MMFPRSVFFVFIWFLIVQCNGQNTQWKLPVEEFQKKMNATKGGQLLDVRTPEEFLTGHLSGARNMNFYAPDFEKSLEKLDKSQPFFVYCKVGGRSAEAAQIMRKQGFREVYEMDGGIMKWSAKNLPMEKGNARNQNKFTRVDFEKMLAQSRPVLIDFYAPWCGPCRRMEPMLARQKSAWADKVIIERINVDEAVELSKSLKVEGIPVFALYINGKEIKRTEGELSQKDLEDWLAPWLK